MQNNCSNKDIYEISKRYKHIGILSAMHQEVGNALENLQNIKEHEFGDLKIFSGEWKSNKEISLSIAWSGWGKVSAARASTRIIDVEYKGSKTDCLLFTGVAGAADLKLNQWDVIVADKIIQHDLDARPLFKRHFIPALNKDILFPSRDLTETIFMALKENFQNELIAFGKVFKGKIATGDTFISSIEDLTKIKNRIQNLLAVEMEGAAVAQVAEQEGIPYAILRVISDSADENANQKFEDFLFDYENNSWKLLERVLHKFL